MRVAMGAGAAVSRCVINVKTEAAAEAREPAQRSADMRTRGGSREKVTSDLHRHGGGEEGSKGWAGEDGSWEGPEVQTGTRRCRLPRDLWLLNVSEKRGSNLGRVSLGEFPKTDGASWREGTGDRTGTSS